MHHLREGCVLGRQRVGLLCRVVDLIWHMAEDRMPMQKVEHQQQPKDLILSKLKTNQVAIKDKSILHPCGLHLTAGQAGP